MVVEQHKWEKLIKERVHSQDARAGELQGKAELPGVLSLYLSLTVVQGGGIFITWGWDFLGACFIPFLLYLVRVSGFLCHGPVWFDPAPYGFVFGMLPGQVSNFPRAGMTMFSGLQAFC